jgi:hypothetical protein
MSVCCVWPEELPRELDLFGGADVRASPAGRVERVRCVTMVYSLHSWRSDSYESEVKEQRGKYVGRGTSNYWGCSGGRRETGSGAPYAEVGKTGVTQKILKVEKTYLRYQPILYPSRTLMSC